MIKIQPKYRQPLLGIALGVLYGLLTRLFFDDSIASITYMVIIPSIIGLIPLFFTGKEQKSAYSSIIFIPWLTMLSFFLLLYILGIEDLLCFFILALPFFILITGVAFIMILVRINRENRRNKLLCIAILPFILMPVEEAIYTPSASYEVSSVKIIHADASTIWNNIVEVNTIQETEYTPGILNWLGVPRPVNATVTKKALGGIRTGTFDGGLQFTELISTYEKDKHIAFNITIGQTSKKNRVFEEHVLKGNYFAFENAAYTLTPLPDGKVKLELSSKYRLTSKVNFYGKLWADAMIEDFQGRLLVVIAKRCEKQ